MWYAFNRVQCLKSFNLELAGKESAKLVAWTKDKTLPPWQVRLCTVLDLRFNYLNYYLHPKFRAKYVRGNFEVPDLDDDSPWEKWLLSSAVTMTLALVQFCFVGYLFLCWLFFVANAFASTTEDVQNELEAEGMEIDAMGIVLSACFWFTLFVGSVPEQEWDLRPRPVSHIELMGRWGAAYRRQAEACKRSCLREQTMGGLYFAVSSSIFMVGAAHNGRLLYEFPTWNTLVCWFLLELFWCFLIVKAGRCSTGRWACVKASMGPFTFSFVRVAALYYHFHSVRTVEGWTEIWWPLCWLIFFVLSLLLQLLCEHLQSALRFFVERDGMIKRRFIEGKEEKEGFSKEGKKEHVSGKEKNDRGARQDTTVHSSQDADDQKVSMVEVSGVGRLSTKASSLLRQAIQVLWCLTFVALLSVEGSCYGDYFVYGGVGAGKFRNGDYHYEGQHNDRPSYIKTVGSGSIQMTRQHWYLNTMNTASSAQYREPLSQHPPEGQWMPEDCDCSDPPPFVSACESGCDYFVSGAGGKGASCNGNYTSVGQLNNRSRYEHDSGNGALLFFEHYWKLSTRELLQESDLQNWHYSVYTPGASQQPPLGQWIVDGDYERSNMDPAPSVSLCEACNDVDLVVTGAGGMGSNCNGNYSFYKNVSTVSLHGDETHLYIKNLEDESCYEAFAVIWLDSDQRWKMTCRTTHLGNQSSWHYAEPEKMTPPTQQWVSTNSCRCSYSGVSVSVCKTCADKSFIVSGASGPHGHANGQYDFSRSQDGKPVYEKSSDARLEVDDSGWQLKLNELNFDNATFEYFAPGLSSASPPTGPWEWVGSNETVFHTATVSRCHRYWPSILVLPIVAILGLACAIYTAARIRTLLEKIYSDVSLQKTSKVSPSGWNSHPLQRC